jgi:uncharacterized membrane protein (UPF0127 family)
MRSLALLTVILLANCGDKPTSREDFFTTDITLPDGQVIKTEFVFDTADALRGMQFRSSIAPDHGMLYAHRVAGKYGYWMYQTLIPLDMIWMDDRHNVVEIVENAPPCKTAASQCPHYGGNQVAKYVLQLGAGMARKYGLKVGDTINW